MKVFFSKNNQIESVKQKCLFQHTVLYIFENKSVIKRDCLRLLLPHDS